MMMAIFQLGGVDPSVRACLARFEPQAQATIPLFSAIDTLAYPYSRSLRVVQAITRSVKPMLTVDQALCIRAQWSCAKSLQVQGLTGELQQQLRRSPTAEQHVR